MDEFEILEDLTSAQLNDIVIQRENTILIGRQDNVGTVGREINLRETFSIPVMSDKDVAQGMGVALLNSTDHKQVWSAFSILVNHVGGYIYYTNVNDEDCKLEIIFI